MFIHKTNEIKLCSFEKIERARNNKLNARKTNRYAMTTLTYATRKENIMPYKYKKYLHSKFLSKKRKYQID